MSNDHVLTLLEALQRWCEPSLVERVRDEECSRSEHEIDGTGRIQLTARAARRQPKSGDWMIGSDFTTLNAAWRELEIDLRQRIERRRIHLRGVQLAPERHTEPAIIPSAWAADFVFDFSKGTIKAGQHRFGAITCSLVPWTPAPAPRPTGLPTAQPISTTLKTLRPEDFPDVDDELILAFLEEHARRVIKNGRPLIAPGKISLMPIIRGKTRTRAANGELQPTVTAESQWLAAWIKEVARLYQVPTALTIKKVLSNDYGLLKARSTGAIQI